MQNTRSIISINELEVVYNTIYGQVRALNRVSLSVAQGEVYGLVGESGCGKSTLGLSISSLLPTPPARINSGKIFFKDFPITDLSDDELMKIRGTGIFMIFQSPLNSLNPVFRVGDQIAEAIQVRIQRENKHFNLQEVYNYGPIENQGFKSAWNESLKKSRKGLRNWKNSEVISEVLSTLESVRISDPERVANSYPHELSGGMRQRVMIAMALSLRPEFLIADEPTSALDVTTQAQILNNMKSLVEKYSTSILFITHDLAVAANISNRVGVMYAGSIVEEASVYNLFKEPLHPYTVGLLKSFPQGNKRTNKLFSIKGEVPNLASLPPGCPFAPRCSQAKPKCYNDRPQLIEVERNRKVACFLYE
ncbi:MAG: ABC transporter ATP-binding protein [Thermoproteota archaeon]|nr:ABC transporter ATP-binding protein [Candidatus Brockarchaeota archaeon]